MRSIRAGRFVPALTFTIFPLVAATIVFVQTGRTQSAADRNAVPSLNVAQYDDEGRLVFPGTADRWIQVGASLGSDYDEQAFDPASPGPFGVVQMEPAAYDYFLANGRYANGTMLLLTFYGVQQKPEPALNGFVQGDVLQREIHVIDRERFPEEGRAFFVFPGTDAGTASPFPSRSACVECHTAHGDLDGTFVQFYPALR